MMDTDFIELIEPTDLYNILNQAFEYPGLSDNNYLLLLDARETHEYNESHVVTAKKAPKDKKGAFVVPYDAELECKQNIAVYDGTSDDITDKETPAYKCAELMKVMGSRNPVKILKGGYEKFSACYPFLRTQKILWLPQELDQIKTYPVEVIQEVLYMGNWRHGNTPYIQKDLKIKAHINCTPNKGELFSEEGQQLMTVPITDEGNVDLKQYLSNACAFIDTHKEKNEPVLVFSDSGVSRASAICIAYIMFSKRTTLEVAYESIRQINTFACPNTRFLNQLREWYNETIGSVTAEP